MNIFILLIIAFSLIVYLLRRKIPIGPAILAGGILMWAVQSLDPTKLLDAAITTVMRPRTYDLLFALYFVMCLEIELRTSGTLNGMVNALKKVFSSNKYTLAIMPAFLGLLPSLGGARFSAPFVEEASKGVYMNPYQKTNVNFWFRHVFEYSNPINPGLIMACSIAMIPISDFIIHLGWLTFVAIILGWVFFIRPLKVIPQQEKHLDESTFKKSIIDIFISLSPVFVNFILVVFFDVGPAIAMGVVVFAMFIALKILNRPISGKEVIVGALDWKLLANISCIFYFIELLTNTNVLNEIVIAFQSLPFPVEVIIAALSFLIGIITGMSQGHVAIVFPIVAAMAPGDINLMGIAMVFGVAGQMLTPTHMCLIITVDYFKSSLFKTIRSIGYMEGLMLIIFSIYTYFLY